MIVKLRRCAPAGLLLSALALGCGSDEAGDGAGGTGNTGGSTGGTGGSAGDSGSAGAGGSAGGTSGTAGAGGDGAGGVAPDAAPDGAIGDCPVFADAVERGTAAEPEITEASGLVASRKNAGVLWVHNDSGDSARAFAMSTDGAALGWFNIPVFASDWEDMALGPGPVAAEDYLYLGDIGDNLEGRGSVLIHRVVEPVVTGSIGEMDLSPVETLQLRYPDRAHDAEALVVDPVNGDLFIVTKERMDATRVFVARAPIDTTTAVTMQELAPLPFGGDGGLNGDLVVAADVSASGHWVIVKTYGTAYLWRRPAGMPLEHAFTTEPCAAPVAVEPQGETIAFAPDDSGYFTLSEGGMQPLYFYSRQ